MMLRYKPILLVGAIIFAFLVGCIDEDYDDCTSGLNVSLYSKSPCQSDTIYPVEIQEVTLCVFDKGGRLVTHQQNKGIKLSKEYAEKLNVPGGLYTVVAWAGLDEAYYNLEKLQDGVTQKDDVLLRLKRAQQVASSIKGARTYYGESPAVYVEAKETETVYVNAAVNLQEVTNRLTVTIEGVSEDIEDYEIYIESNNGSMSVGGEVVADELLKHESTTLAEAGVIKADFTLLKLETGHTNTIVIKNKATDTELYRGSLLGTLLLKNPEVNLNCDHDFTIKFTAEDQCSCGTYTIMEIWVNNWLVHSYDKEL